MKLNWGNGIAIFYGMFMLVMIVFVIKSRNVDHSLVVDNYYEEDITYQQHLDKVANSKSLATDLSIERQTDQELRIQFPDLPGEISGEVWFYRPNDNTMDFRFPVKTDLQGLQIVRTAEMLPGRWKVKVEWQAGDKAYYKEKELYL